MLGTDPLGAVPKAGPSPSPGLTSSSKAIVIRMAQPHMPARPRRWRVRRPARSTRNTCGESRAWRAAFGAQEWEGLGGWGQVGHVKPVVGASSYRDQGEHRVDHTSAYGGVGWLPDPRCLEDAGRIVENLGAGGRRKGDGRGVPPSLAATPHLTHPRPRGGGRALLPSSGADSGPPAPPGGCGAYSVDARELLTQLQHDGDGQGLPVGAAAQELEQGQRPLALQLPLLLLQLGQRSGHVGPAGQALQTWGRGGAGLRGRGGGRQGRRGRGGPGAHSSWRAPPGSG